MENIKRFLFTFGHLTTLGFNIYRYNFDIDFLFEYINKYGLKRHLRLGLAHPIPGQTNAYIKPKDFDKFTVHFREYMKKFETYNVEPGFDCGFPLCFFSDDDVGKLFKLNRGRVGFNCGPAVDIGPDMTVWACFPLSNYKKKSIFEFSSMQEILKYYMDMHEKIRAENSGILDECGYCPHFINKLCSGGCLAHSLNKYVNSPKLRIMEAYPDEQ
jgi:radical SAM protein with 4Fe4S-binding SPASM domain